MAQTVAKKEFERWMQYPHLSLEMKQDMEAIKDNAEEIELRFGSSMSFGTAGLRATMHAGPACMNVYTVAQATQGIAALLLQENGQSRGVAIAYDSRNHSRDFAIASAEVLAGNGICVYLFDDIRPTPELSFAVRELGCMAGINITASHNPKEYNGYKAYWEDGAQISPAQTKVVADAIGQIDMLGGAKSMPLDEGVEKGLIHWLGSDFDKRYLEAVEKTAVNPTLISETAESLKIVYTPLHGTGYRLVPDILHRAGLRHLYTVPSQMVPDGDFPTVAKPNPEYAEVFAEGIALAEEKGSDLVIATDPDADRVGVMSRTKDGSFTTITGNQMGALLLDYVISARRERGVLSKNDYAVKSFVSTDLACKITEESGVTLYDVFTGFKFIGEVIKNYETSGKEGTFLCGFEESYGYLFGTYARDKDAVGAVLLIVEMTAYYRKKEMTLSDALQALYEKYGLYREGVLDLYMTGLDGIERRQKTMDNLRQKPPVEIGGVQVLTLTDHLAQTTYSLANGSKTSTGCGVTDALYFVLENGDKVVVRPSGTEPKIKLYFLCHGENDAILSEQIEKYKQDMQALV
ncbi:MAG: phospho-sugar mutase [Clostridia bacterium]|nr:phospho-sugar mutase [Clostridia bacterium]